MTLNIELKLDRHWRGPGEVLELISKVVYRVQMLERRRTVVLHRDHLVPYQPLAHSEQLGPGMSAPTAGSEVLQASLN